MTGNYGFHIRGAAVTNFDGISVEYFVISVVGGEVLVDELQELLSYVGSDVCAERWIKPYDVSGSCTFGGLVAYVIEFGTKSTTF